MQFKSKKSKNELNKRSPKSKEVFADSLMAHSSKLVSTMLVAVFMIPLSMVIRRAQAVDADKSVDWMEVLNMVSIDVVVIAAIILTGVFVAVDLRKKALDIYDELHRSE